MISLRRWLSQVPVTIKVPVVVAFLMAAVGIVASEVVLSRLIAFQERQIRELTNAYLDGLASPLIEPVLRGDPWEIFDTLDQARQLSSAVKPVETIVTDARGVVLAASDPRLAPVGTSLPAEFPIGQDHTTRVLIREPDSRAFVDRVLVVEGRKVGTLHAEFDISPLLAERHEVLLALLSTNAVLTFGFMILGWFAVRRMVRPLKVLSDHLAKAQDGRILLIPIEGLPRPDTEAGRLFRRFNEMVNAVTENEALAARLSREERMASLGRLASGMAHEINNPLGGLFNAIDTLKKHGDKPMVRASSLSLVERGLFGIRDVVQAALTTYRAEDRGRLLTKADLEDIRLLIGPELRRRGQVLEWNAEAAPLPPLPGTLVRQVALNLLLNASAAGGERGQVRFSATTVAADTLILDIADSGRGMSVESLAVLQGDQTDVVGTGKGLGLWMVRRIVDELGGRIEISRSSLGGTKIRIALVAPSAEVETNAA